MNLDQSRDITTAGTSSSHKRENRLGMGFGSKDRSKLKDAAYRRER